VTSAANARPSNFEVTFISGDLQPIYRLMQLIIALISFNVLPPTDSSLPCRCPWCRTSPRVSLVVYAAIDKASRCDKVGSANDTGPTLCTNERATYMRMLDSLEFRNLKRYILGSMFTLNSRVHYYLTGHNNYIHLI
jgi:hypothetical protein